MVEMMQVGDGTINDPYRSVESVAVETVPETALPDSPGLRKFFESSSQAAAKALSEFNQLATRLQRGEDVPATAIAKACERAEKTPGDLQAAMVDAADLLKCVELIELARQTVLASAPILETSMPEDRRRFKDREQVLLDQLVELELDRRASMTKQYELVNANREARQAADRAMIELVPRAEEFGVEIPESIPSLPAGPSGFMPVKLELDHRVMVAVASRLRDARTTAKVPIPETVATAADSAPNVQAEGHSLPKADDVESVAVGITPADDLAASFLQD